MFRKVDRERLAHLEYVENKLNYLKPMAETVAAQLKAIADSQARLEVNVGERLAAIETIRPLLDSLYRGSAETLERLARLAERLGAIEQRLDDVKVLIGQTQQTVRDSHGALTEYKLEAIAECVGEIALRLNKPKANGKHPVGKRSR